MALNGLRMSQKQLESFAHADADASKGRVNIWHGAVRSGKTVGSLLASLSESRTPQNRARSWSSAGHATPSSGT